MERFLRNTTVATKDTSSETHPGLSILRPNPFPFFLATILGLSLIIRPDMAAAHRFEWYDGVWAHEETTQTPNPAMTFGKLDNGLRWVLYPSKSHPQRLSLQLDVQAGALMEEPHESGAAHFLQQLAKEGTQNWNKEELRFFLTANSISLENDIRNETRNEATVFRLKLPGTDALDLQHGLKLLRNIADGLPIREDTVEKVKSEIVSQLIMRNRKNNNVYTEWRRFLYEGTRLIQSPTGELKSVRSMTPDTLRKFYKKWYVPGRMVVVVVGDIDPKTVENLVKASFGSLPRVHMPFPDDTGTPLVHGVKAFVRNVPEMTTTRVSINIVTPLWPVMATKKNTRYRIFEDLLRIAIQRRLDKLTESDPDLWIEAFQESHRFDPPQPVLSLKAKTFNRKWRQALRTLGKEFVSICTYGITQEEFQEVKAEHELFLRRMVEEEQLLENEDIAERIVNDVNFNHISFSAKQNLENFHEHIDTLTLEELNWLFKSTLHNPNRVIEVVGDNDTTEKEVRQIWSSLEAEMPVQHLTAQRASFPYLEEPLPVPASIGLTRQRVDENLDFVLWATDLSNGLKVYFQPLEFQKGRVRVDFLFGDGLNGVEGNGNLIPRLAVHTLAQNGVGRLSKSDSAQIFRSRGLRIRESLDNHYNVIVGESRSNDIELLLQAVWTQFKDPLITEKNLQLALNRIRANENSRLSSVNELAKIERTHFFSGFDPRTLPLEYDEVKGIDAATVTDYIEDVRKRGDQILYISGDFDLQQTVQKVVQLFSDLPIIFEPGRNFDMHMAFPSGRRQIRTLKHDKSGRATVSVGWHSNLSSPGNRREVVMRTMIAELANDRLREKLKSATLPGTKSSVMYRKFTDFDGFGYFLVEVQGHQQELRTIEKAITDVTNELLRSGVTADEIDLIRAPLRSQCRSKLYTNHFWSKLILNTIVADVQNIIWYGQTVPLIDEIHVEEVNEAIREIFSSEQATLILKSAT